MPWSTREVADLAGTTINTVRHYHAVGLLAEPERSSNGYKRYEVAHLVRLLQIRRLRDLGVPLTQIEEVGFSSESRVLALQAIDADLAASIARLQRVRGEIAAILQGSSGTGMPSGFEEVSSGLTDAEQSMMLIWAQLYDEDAMNDLRSMLADEPGEVDEDFQNLPPDAADADIQRIAERYTPTFVDNFTRYPWLHDQRGHIIHSPKRTEDTVVATITALYNRAQREVIARASRLAAEQMAEAGSVNADPAPDRT